MYEIHPKILTDDKMQPVAVQIDYADWLEIDKLLNLDRASGKPVDLSRFAGTLKWGEDAIAYQRRVRECDHFPN